MTVGDSTAVSKKNAKAGSASAKGYASGTPSTVCGRQSLKYEPSIKEEVQLLARLQVEVHEQARMIRAGMDLFF